MSVEEHDCYSTLFLSMMSNVEQSLTLLLPSLSDHLPPELIALSNSLLAQSRNNAGNLKAEEEIGRPYACSEIACKRLENKLNLPALHGRPPCAPRVYKKLLGFLEHALPAKRPGKAPPDNTKGSKDGASVRRTPKNPNPLSTNADPSTTPSQASNAFTGKVLHTDSTRATRDDNGAPPWTMPLIRHLCSTFATPLLPPHVYTGFCVVSRLADLEYERRAEDAAHRKDATCLALALFFMVLSKMQRGKVINDGYLKDSERACAVANEDLPDGGVQKADVDEWIKRISSKNWATGQDWWSSVPENVFDRAGEPSADDVEDDYGTDLTIRRKRTRDQEFSKQDPAGKLLPGLGTMMQDSIDWLSEEKRADYLDWRELMENKLESLEIQSNKTPAKTKSRRTNAR
jgi:origin recognition complex subunit 6